MVLPPIRMLRWACSVRLTGRGVTGLIDALLRKMSPGSGSPEAKSPVATITLLPPASTFSIVCACSDALLVVDSKRTGSLPDCGVLSTVSLLM